MQKLKIAVGSDHGGYELKEKVKTYIEELGYEFHDFGTHDMNSADYPVIAKEVAKNVAGEKFDRGIIICGSGLGVAIAANKVKGIRAATCNDIYCAEMSRLHNDANILTMGGRIIDENTARKVVKIWIETAFEGGRHRRRVDMIEE